MILHPGALHHATGWHATSAGEAEEIRALGFKQPVCLAPNGVAVALPAEEEAARTYWRENCPEAFARPTALFYSRFHRKKRVLELIDLWLAHAPSEWLLLLVGIPQEYTVEQLQSYVLRNSGGGRVLVHDGTEAPPPYAAASLFLLPSHSENFGLVVAEALAHGLPALVTDTTPWQALNATDYGWCGPWEHYREALLATLAQGPDRLHARGAAARDWVVREYSWEKSARLLADFYASLRR
jgi:glycosyltransferase involved in cell wall biosynthesis